MQRLKLFTLNVFCILLLAYFMVLAWQHVISSTPFFSNDYKTFYISLRSEKNMYRPHYYYHVLEIEKYDNKVKLHLTSQMSSVNMNTPPMNFLLKGLVNESSQLSVNAFLWMLYSVLGVVISLALLMRFFNASDVNRYYFIPLVLLLWLSWPSLYDLQVGELTYFVLPLLCAGFLLLYFRQWIAMTVVLALLASLKLFFLVFVLLFIPHRQWRLMCLFVALFLVFFFLPLLYFPWSDYQTFFQLTHHYAVFVSRALLPMNGSLLGVVSHIFQMKRDMNHSMAIRAITAIICLSVITLFMLYDYFHLRKLRAFSDELRFSFLIPIALLCSPLGWEYYSLFLLVPVILIFKVCQRYVLSMGVYIFLVLALCMPYFAWTGLFNKLTPMIQNCAVFVSLLCWLFCLHFVTRVVARDKARSFDQQRIVASIFVIYSLINVLLLTINFGMPYFLDLNQARYLKNESPVVQFNHSNPILQIQRHSS